MASASRDLALVGSSMSRGGGDGAASSAGDSDSRNGSRQGSLEDADGFRGFARVAVAELVNKWMRAAPKLKFLATWKLQFLFASYQCLVIIMYALHPVLGWNIDNGSAWIHVMRAVTLFALPSTQTGASAKRAALVILYVCMVMELFYLIIISHILWVRGSAHRGLAFLRFEARFARFLEVMMFKTGAFAILGVLLIPVTCNTSRFSTFPPNANLLVPGATCAPLPAYATPSVVAAAFHAAMVILCAIKDSDLDFSNGGSLAPVSAVPMSRVTALQMTALFIFHFLLRDNMVVFAVLLCLLWLWATYVLVVRVPYPGFMHPILRASVCGGQLGLFIGVAAHLGGWPHARALMGALAPLLAVGAGAATCLRQLAARRVVLMYASRPGAAEDDLRLHRFMDEEAVEAMLRVPAAFSPVGKLDETLIDGALEAIKHMALLEQDSTKILNFLAAGQAFLARDIPAARSTTAKIDTTKGEGFFTRLYTLRIEAHLWDLAGAEGEEVDVSSLDELQEQLRLAMNLHRKAVEAKRDVWRVASRQKVGVGRIGRALWRVHAREKAAQLSYRILLQRYPANARLLRTSGAFLHFVAGNANEGNMFVQEAERIETNAEFAVKLPAKKLKGRGGMPEVADDQDATVVVDTQGIMELVSAPFAELLGYATHELLGRNLAMLMPPSLAAMHGGFIRGATANGSTVKERVIAGVVALKRGRMAIGVSVHVSAVVQGGRVTFVGVLNPSLPARAWDQSIFPGTLARAWLSPEGHMVVAVDAPLASMLGRSPGSVMGAPVEAVLPGAHELLRSLSGSGAESAEGLLRVGTGVAVGGGVLAQAQAVPAGTDRAPLVLLTVMAVQHTKGSVTVERASGRVVSADGGAEAMLHAGHGGMVGRQLWEWMPGDVQDLHRELGEAGAGQGDRPPAPCMLLSGPLRMRTLGGRHVYVNVEIDKGAAITHGANELALTLTLCAPTDASGHVTIDVDSSGRIIHASGLQAAFFTHALTKRPSRLPPPHPTTSRAALMGPSQRELTAMPTAAHQASSSALPAANPMQGSFAEASLTGPGGGVGESSVGRLKQLGELLELAGTAKDIMARWEGEGDDVGAWHARAMARMGDARVPCTITPAGRNGGLLTLRVAPITRAFAVVRMRPDGMVSGAWGDVEAVLGVPAATAIGQELGLQEVSGGGAGGETEAVLACPDGATVTARVQVMERGQAGMMTVAIRPTAATAFPPLSPLPADSEDGSELDRAFGGKAASRNDAPNKPTRRYEDADDAEGEIQEIQSRVDRVGQGATATAAGGPGGLGPIDVFGDEGDGERVRGAESITSRDPVRSDDGGGSAEEEESGREEGGSRMGGESAGHGFSWLRMDEWADKGIAPSGMAASDFGQEMALSKAALMQLERAWMLRAGPVGDDNGVPRAADGAGAAAEASQGGAGARTGQEPRTVTAATAQDQAAGGNLGASSSNPQTLGQSGSKAGTPPWVPEGGVRRPGSVKAGSAKAASAKAASEKGASPKDTIGRQTLPVEQQDAEEVGPIAARNSEGSSRGPDGRRVGRMHQIHALLSTKMFLQPLTRLRAIFVAVAMPLAVIHTAGFAASVVAVKQHHRTLTYLESAGSQSPLALRVLLYSRIVVSSAAGYPCPWVPADTATSRMLDAAAQLSARHTALQHAGADASLGKWRETVESLWRDPDLPIQVVGTQGATQVRMMSYYDAVASFTGAAQALAVASPPPDASSYSFHFIADNLAPVLLPRMRQIEDALAAAARDSVSPIRSVAIGFLVAEVAVAAPMAALALWRGLRGFKELRVTLLSLLVAVPRPLAVDLGQREVTLEGVADEDDEGGHGRVSEEGGKGGEEDGEWGGGEGGWEKGKGGAAAGERQKSKGRQVQHLMGVRIPAASATRARALVASGSAKERRGFARNAMEFAALGAVVAWAGAVIAVYARTLSLASEELLQLDPQHAFTVYTSQVTQMLVWANEMVAQQMEGAGAAAVAQQRALLQQATGLTQEAVSAVIFGASDLEGSAVQGGTVWSAPELKSLWFGDVCLDPAGCVSMYSDPLSATTRRGMYILTTQLIEQAKRLVTDPDQGLTYRNARAKLIGTVGTKHLQTGLQLTDAYANTDADQLGNITAIQASMTAVTWAFFGVMAAVLLRPLFNAHRTEIWRLCQVLADLPEDVGMDALIVDVARHMHGRSTSQEEGLYLRDLVRDRVGEKREKETSDW